MTAPPRRCAPLRALAPLSLAWGLALAAQAAPVQWAGEAGPAWARLYVDGQKATGAVRANTARGLAEVSLSGSGADGRYSGTLEGVGRRDEEEVPLRGTWQAALGTGSGTLNLLLRASQGSGGTPLRVALAPTAGYPLLRLAWLRGTARRVPAAGAPAALRMGERLALGDTVETGPASSAILTLGDGGVVLMQERTRVQVPDAEDNRGERVQRVRAAQGKVWFAVRKVQERGKFEVETDEVVAAVRGTEFLVEVTPETGASITTAEGEVAVTDTAREAAPVPVGEGMEWSPGRPLGNRAPFDRGTRRLDAAAFQARLAAWLPLLQEADRHWPFRREGKRRFWMRRFARPAAGPGAAPGAAPGSAPGASVRPGEAPRGFGAGARQDVSAPANGPLYRPPGSAANRDATLRSKAAAAQREWQSRRKGRGGAGTKAPAAAPRRRTAPRPQ